MNHSPIKCIECGRFIGYADIESGKAKADYTPDSHFTCESIDYICSPCACKENCLCVSEPNPDCPIHGRSDWPKISLNSLGGFNMDRPGPNPMIVKSVNLPTQL